MASSREEILNDGGLRTDFRRPHELRHFSLSIPTSTSASQGADGLATCSHGLTVVTSAVHGPKEARNRGGTLFDRAVINVDVAVGSWAGNERRKRGRTDKRIQELAQAIKTTFEPVIMTSLYPRSEINIYIQVLAMDGALLQTALNATTLSLLTSGISLSDSLLALSLTPYQPQTTLLDLTASEESSLPHVTLAFLPRSGKITTAQLEGRMTVEGFEECVRVAGEAVGVLRSEMEGAVKEWAKRVGAGDLGVTNGASRSGAGGPRDGDDDDMEI